MINNNLMQGGGRIAYLDALRGFTMILVVWHHVANYSFGLKIEDSLLMEIFISFRMPMFFFISGFIAFKDSEFWNTTNTLNRFSTKAKVQIIPAIVFWLAGGLIMGGRSIGFMAESFLTTFPGYWWFTIGLFMMFSAYFSTALLSHYTSKHILFPLLIIITLAMIMFKNVFIGSTIANTLTLPYVTRFFPFFIFGLFLRKNMMRFFQLLDNSYFITLCIAIVCILTFFSYGTGIILSHNLLAFIRTVIGFPFIVLIFKIFYNSKNFWNEKTRFTQVMTFIGRRTLDIYLLHFFFIPDFNYITPYIIGVNQTVPQVVFVTTVSLTIVLLSLSVSGILRLSPFFAKWLFGANKQHA